MLYIYFVVAGIIIFGGIIAYALGTAMIQLDAAQLALYPALATDQGFLFVSSIWFWMVLIILIGAVLYVVVNSQREKEGLF